MNEASIIAAISYDRGSKGKICIALDTMADTQKDWRRDENDEEDEAEQELDEAVSRRKSHLGLTSDT